MLKWGGVALVAMTAVATPAWPCSVVGPLPAPQQLVSRAEVIVRARAERLADAPGRQGHLAGGPTQVVFSVLEVLKGALASNMIEFNGSLEEREDPNDRPVPYDFIRPGGRRGNCFALGYQQGAEYLLFLKRADHQSYSEPHDLTPYWSPLAPTNEQLSGAMDPWLRWVINEVRKGARPGA
jgi:hypothetical protein